MKNSLRIKRLVGIATLCAITFVLQFWIAGVMPKLPIGGGTAINLALIPVVVGAILYGPTGGLYVGLFLGAVTLLPGQGAEGFYVNWYMTILAILLCLAKTGLAGFAAGWVYRLFAKIHFAAGIYTAAFVTPCVNTGIYLLLIGVLVNIMTGQDYGEYFVLVASVVWISFLIELAVNVLLAPAIATLIKVVTRNYNLGFSNDFSSLVVEDEVVEENEEEAPALAEDSITDETVQEVE